MTLGAPASRRRARRCRKRPTRRRDAGAPRAERETLRQIVWDFKLQIFNFQFSIFNPIGALSALLFFGSLLILAAADSPQ